MARIIAITGKGGTGKTTIAALMIKCLKESANSPVLALDADPDCNLATVLGIRVEKTIGDMREETKEAMMDFPPGMSKEAYVEAGLHQVIVETDKVDLITMGRSEGSGCYCYINSLLRKFADELGATYPWVVMDNEAGLEPLSRGMASKIDHLVVVVNANPLSVDCAARIDKLVASVKNPVGRKHYLINSTPRDKVEELKRQMGRLDMEYLGHIPYDSNVEESVFKGGSLFDVGDSPAVAEMRNVMKKIGAT